MKKFLLISALLLSMLSLAKAQNQPRTVGLKLGGAVELSYQHSLKPNTFVEANLGLSYSLSSLSRSMYVNASWNQILYTNKFDNAGVLNFYMGAGPELGIYMYRSILFQKSIPYAGAEGHGAIEFSFDAIPLTLSLDLGLVVKPTLLFVKMPLVDLYDFRSGLGIRYNF